MTNHVELYLNGDTIKCISDICKKMDINENFLENNLIMRLFYS